VSGWTDTDIRYVGACCVGHRVAGVLADFDPERTREDYYTRGFYVTTCLSTRDDARGCFSTIVLRPVVATTGRRECGPWCTDGTGRKCTCVCEGRNHSSTYSHTGALWYAR
jgi:hypothetical protein